MPKNVSLKELQRLRGRVASMAKRGEKLKQEAALVVSRVIDAAEIAGTCFGFGVLQGRQGEMPSVLGVPVDLLTGIGMHGLAFLGVGDEMNRHFIAIGNGGLASYGHNIGVSVGAGMEGAPSAAPALPPGVVETSGMDLTPEEEYSLRYG